VDERNLGRFAWTKFQGLQRTRRPHRFHLCPMQDW
jgi:hypothetical protein